MASCRLVNKQWYGESLTFWRTTFPIRITPRTPLKTYMELRDEPLNQFSKKPYSNLNCEYKFNLNSKEFRIFWTSIGSHLTKLLLLNCTFQNNDEFRQVIYTSCPILQTLVLDLNYAVPFATQNLQNAFVNKGNNGLDYPEPLYGEHKHLRSLEIALGTKLPVSWTELFLHFPLLTTCATSICIEIGEFESLIEAIRTVRKKDNNYLPFKHFKIYSPLTISRDLESSHRFALIKELSLPLMGCCIAVHPELDQRFLRTTLEYLAPSLEWIRIDRGRNEKVHEIPTWFHNFPFGIPMNNLTHLESEDGHLQNFSFLKYTPKLKAFICQPSWIWEREGYLNLDTKMVSNTCKEELANVQLPQLRRLVLPLIEREAELEHLFKWMPNVRNLETLLRNEQFGKVCQNWKNLRELYVKGFMVTAEGITDMEKVRKAKKDGGVGILPNIANLKDLEILILALEPYCGEYFTPEAVCHLFIHLPRLQHFSVGSKCAVERSDIDIQIASYKRAIQDNVLAQWIAENPRMGPFPNRGWTNTDEFIRKHTKKPNNKSIPI